MNKNNKRKPPRINIQYVALVASILSGLWVLFVELVVK